MAELQMGTVETQFAEMIWELEPVHSRELVRLAEEKLDWKKSTTYTVLKRLCDKGIFVNNNSMVTSLIKRDVFFALQSEQFVEETFAGSLPAFLAAFTSRRGKLSKAEVEELRRMVEEYEEE